MPNLEEELEYIEGSYFFAQLDLVDGYTQCSLHRSSRELFSAVTKFGVFSPKRVPQGASCSVAYFQAAMEEVFRPLIRKGLLLYIDDLLLYAKTLPLLLKIVEKVFKLAKIYNIKISALKSNFLATEVKWCGRLISAKGIRHDPERISGLSNMGYPINGAQLYQFVCAAGWMRTHIPYFSDFAKPLLEVLMMVKKVANSNKKAKCFKVVLNEKVGWEERTKEAFNRLKEAILKQVHLSHPDSEKEVILCSDASDTHWGGVITQVDAMEWNRLIAETDVSPDDHVAGTAKPSPPLKKIASLSHQPLAFISGEFKGAQLNWSTGEKEMYSLRTILLRYAYLFYRDRGVICLTDHRNLQYSMGKESKTPLPAYVVAKLYRWYISIMNIPYRIRYLPGETNDWADMLSRWGARPNFGRINLPREPECARESERVESIHQEWDLVGLTKTISALHYQLPHPELKDVEFPSKDELRTAQQETGEEPPGNTTVDDDGLIRFESPEEEDSIYGQVWLPRTAKDIIIRIMVVVHARDGVHSSQDQTIQLIRERFKWHGMYDDIRRFVRECLHCLRGTNNIIISRPLGSTLVAQYPNEVVHIDYLSLDLSPEGEDHVVIIKDGCTGYLY
eukprot:GHVU01099173.1.p1 GENE.GHVU01099173.1~~GHVU01099173.1.p1  ORF type:complete len:619 (-),score=68.79 GHVU01099173.1:336-2192(-)